MAQYENMDKDTLAAKAKEVEDVRRAAFFGVCFSTVATLVIVVSVPMVYSYVQHVQSVLDSEAAFCQSRSSDLWEEVAKSSIALALGPPDARHKRSLKRSQPHVWPFGNRYGPGIPAYAYGGSSVRTFPARFVQPYGLQAQGYGGSVPGFQPPINVGVNDGGSCCTCQQGPVGLPGQEGPPGLDGSDGVPGPDGSDGRPAPPARFPDTPFVSTCQRCAPARPGRPGTPGPKGFRGLPGDDGRDRESGGRGLPGLPGRPGPRGIDGRAGLKGNRGRDGQTQVEIGPLGPPGPPGRAGSRGVPGRPGSDGVFAPPGPVGPVGDNGAAGLPGLPGIPGPKGPDGFDGNGGSCDHCPPPRTAPGY